MPLARSCPICILSPFSIFHSPLADSHWESVSITWPNNNLMQHWLFSLPIFNSHFPFYSFILLLFFFLLLLFVCPCVPSAIVSGCLRCPLATLGPFWPLFTQLVSLLLQFLQFMARFLFDISQEAVAEAAGVPCSRFCLPFLLTTSWKASFGPAQWTTEQWRSRTFD